MRRTALFAHETGRVGEPIPRMDGARELDERPVLPIVAAYGAERGTARIRSQQHCLALAQPNRLDALLDPRDSNTVRPLEHRRVRSGHRLEVLVDVGQAGVD